MPQSKSLPIPVSNIPETQALRHPDRPKRATLLHGQGWSTRRDLKLRYLSIAVPYHVLQVDKGCIVALQLQVPVLNQLEVVLEVHLQFAEIIAELAQLRISLPDRCLQCLLG